VSVPEGSRPAAELAVTGRFQPFHHDHLALVLELLTRAERVIVGITNPDDRSLQAVPTSSHRHRVEANPFGFLARKRMIEAALTRAGVPSDRYDVVPFPLDAPEVWSSYIPLGTTQVVRVYSEWESAKAAGLADGGYPVLELQGDLATRLSATDVRAAMREGRAWRHLVPDGAREVLEGIDAQARERACVS
jgi:nicotinamide mononucleotide adenylyltransferase